jgi:hypothetical protein
MIPNSSPGGRPNPLLSPAPLVQLGALGAQRWPFGPWLSAQLLRSSQRGLQETLKPHPVLQNIRYQPSLESRDNMLLFIYLLFHSFIHSFIYLHFLIYIYIYTNHEETRLETSRQQLSRHFSAGSSRCFAHSVSGRPVVVDSGPSLLLLAKTKTIYHPKIH